MKILISTILLCFFSLQSHAQFAKNHSIYFQHGFSLGTHLGISTSLNYIYKNTYSLEFGGRFYGQKSKERPSDFKGGIATGLTLGIADGNDLYTDIHVLAGRIIPLNIPGRRLNLKAGLSYTDVTKSVNFQSKGESIFGGNYSYDEHRFSTMSIIINPILEYPFSQFVGLYVSGQLIVNKESAFFGVGCGVIYGLLRDSEKDTRKSHGY